MQCLKAMEVLSLPKQGVWIQAVQGLHNGSVRSSVFQTPIFLICHPQLVALVLKPVTSWFQRDTSPSSLTGNKEGKELIRKDPSRIQVYLSLQLLRQSCVLWPLPVFQLGILLLDKIVILSVRKKGRLDIRQETCSVLQHTGKEQIKTNVNDVLRENKFKAVFV